MTPEEKYTSYTGVPFSQPDRLAGITVGILPELHGEPFDEDVVNKIALFNPSCIRVGDVLSADYVDNRVTVYIDDEGNIESIEMEMPSQENYAGTLMLEVDDNGKSRVNAYFTGHDSKLIALFDLIRSSFGINYDEVKTETTVTQREIKIRLL